MSRRSTRDDEPAAAATSGGGGGGFNPSAGDYEGEIKKAQEELKELGELEGKQAKGEKLSEEDTEKIRGGTDERARVGNKIAQLRSEATRKGLRLTV